MANQGLEAGYVPATQQIQFPGGGGFAVRGLGLPDISAIYRNHAGELGLWFERLQDTGELQRDTAVVLINGLLTSAPVLVCAIIAAAADVTNPDHIDSLAKMPIAVQFEALMKIGELSFTSEMPPKKVMEIVIQMIRTAAPNLALGT